MIVMRRLKNVVLFLLTKIIKIHHDIARKHGNVIVKDFQKYEKLKCKQTNSN